MRLLLLLLISLGCRCTTLPSEMPYPNTIDPLAFKSIKEFRDTVASYGWHTDRYLWHVSFDESRFEGMDDAVVGFCTVGIGQETGRVYPSVVFREQWKTRLDTYSWKALFFHEYSHCLLGLDHTEDKDSLMYPYIPFELEAKFKWKKLLDHTFDPEGITKQK